MVTLNRNMDQLLDESPDIEYSIEIDDYDFDHTSNQIKVIGQMKKAVRYDLEKLMESNLRKHKEILKSLVITTVEKNSRNGFKCLLYRNYQISPLNDKNQTVVHLAFYHASGSIISELANYLESETSQELDLTDYVDDNGLTHLHVACAMGNMKLIDKYSQNTPNINARYVSSGKYNKHNDGFTPLHFLMINRKNYNKDIVELLVKRGADVNAVDDVGRTPLHMASCFSTSLNNNSLQVMKALIDSEADVNAKDVNGNTPLLIAFPDEVIFLEKKNDFTKIIEEMEQKLKLLLQGGADLNAKNNINNTVLHLAMGYLEIRQGFGDYKAGFSVPKIIKLLQLLLSHNQEIDMNIVNNFEQTPLSLAVSYLSTNIVKFFLDHHASLDGIKFNSKIDTFFKHPYGTLTLEPLQKLIEILDLLSDRGLTLTPKDNLVVLKFLTYEIKSFGIGDYDFKSDLFHMMCIESSEDLQKVLKDFNIDFNDDYREYYESSEEYLDHYDNLHEYLYCINAAEVFIDKHSKALIKQALNRCKEYSRSDYSPSVEENDIYEEFESLESIVPVGNKSLEEVLMDKPEETALHFAQKKFDISCLDNLDHFYGIAKGHITASLIRYYVIEESYNIVKDLYFTPLPYDCYELISNYLSNKDIFNLCMAILE